MKGNSSADYDKIPEFLIKQCVSYIKKPLVRIFNAFFNSGIFPDVKIAKVRLSLKKRDRQNVRYYRPMSILPVFPKILEKLTYNRLIPFVNIVFYQKHRMKSIETASQNFIESIQETMDQCQHVVGIFWILQKDKIF